MSSGLYCRNHPSEAFAADVSARMCNFIYVEWSTTDEMLGCEDFVGVQMMQVGT